MRSGSPAPGRKLLRVAEDGGTIFDDSRAQDSVRPGRQGRWPKTDSLAAARII
jgi:hypothetical protein